MEGTGLLESHCKMLSGLCTQDFDVERSLKYNQGVNEALFLALKNYIQFFLGNIAIGNAKASISVFFGSLPVQACLLCRGLRVTVAWLCLGHPRLFSACLKAPTFWGRGYKSLHCVDNRE